MPPSRRRIIRTLGSTIVLVLSGCSAIVGIDQRAPNPSPRETTVPSTPTDATAGNTVEYSELSATEKRAFDAAVEDKARFFYESPYVEGEYFDPEVANPFERYKYVRKDGSFYELSSQNGELFASYQIRTTKSQPGENATVVAFQDLSSGSSSAVRQAVENGSYTAPFGKWNTLPDGLSGVDYVRYSDEHYRIQVVVGDAWVQVWNAERA